MDNYRNAATSLVADELQRIIEEFIGENYPRDRGNRNSQQQQFFTEYSLLINSLRDVLMAYNDNMREYQENIRLFQQIMLGIQQDMTILMRRNNVGQTNGFTYRSSNTNDQRSTRQRSNQPFHSTASGVRPRQTGNRTNSAGLNDNFLSFLIYPRRTATADTLRGFNTPVVVRPTTEQINIATELLDYSDETHQINTNCPITLEEFQNGEQVRRIKQCGHVFKEPAIQNWFSEHVRCPVCRYDIRDYSEYVQDPSMNEPIENDADTETNGLSAFQNIINAYASDYGTDNDMSGNIFYSVQLPLYYNTGIDASGNLMYFEPDLQEP
jgi:hypothetical protein